MPESDPSDSASPAPSTVPACPNCGRDRPGSFCGHCGQSDRDYRRSLRSVLSEFVRETFEIDSRLYRTLTLLLFRPGRLAAEFSRNRRARYMSPVRLYIFASFVFFLVLSTTSGLGSPDGAITIPPNDGLTEDMLPSDDRIEAFKAALPEEYRTKVQDILDRPESDGMRQAVLGFATQDPGEMGGIDRFFLFGAIELFHDPSLAGERIISNLPIAMFFLLPLYALILAVFQFRKRRFFVEHLVLAIHVQTFLFVVYGIAMLLPGEGVFGWIRLICALLPYPYFAIALRRYYGDGWVLTVLKSIGVLTLYSLVFAPAFLVSVFVMS